MEIPGAEILRQLRASRDGIRADATRLRGDWQAIDSHLAELVSRRTKAIVELAQLYLPSLSAETIGAAFAEIRAELQQLLERKQRQQAELAARRSRLAEDVAAIDSRLAEQEASIAAQRCRQQSLAEEVTRLLGGHEEFQRLSQRVLATETELKKNEQRAEKLASDAAGKLPAYHRSTLFQYLLKREYGTERHDSRGWMRRWDRWLANLIGYTTAKRGFDFLSKAPLLVAEEVKRRRQEFELQMEQMEAIEENFAAQVGLTQLLAEIETLSHQKEQTLQRRRQQAQTLQQVEQQLLQLERDGGPFYEDALTRLRQFLDRTATTVLQQRARQTPTPIDDEIVTRIETLNRDIETTRPKIARLQENCRTAEGQNEGIDFVMRRFDQADFDSKRSRFSTGLDLGRLLQQFQGGGLSKDALWEELRTHQRFEPTPLERQATEIAMHPMTGVMLEALVRAAGGVAQAQARRSIGRRTLGEGFSAGPVQLPPMQLPRWERSSHVPSPPPAPISSSPPSRPHGYSSGKGF